MSDRFDFWIHGVNVQVEYPERVLRLARKGWGTEVEQAMGTSNWFHFAIPTPTWLDDDKVDYQHAWFRGTINNRATVKKVTVHVGGDRGRLVDKDVSLSARELDESIDLPDERCTNPLVLCVFVEFDGEGGQVTFSGAGARFREWT